MSRSRIAAGLLAAALATSAVADVDLVVRADRPSRIYLGGEFLGDTPLVLRGLEPGNHTLQIEDLATREVRTFMVPSPASVTVERTLDVRWTGTSPGGVVVPTAQTAAPASAPPPKEVRRAESRGKTHTRNVLLGATVLSTVLTKDSRDRKRRRNVGLGAIGLNQVLRR